MSLRVDNTSNAPAGWLRGLGADIAGYRPGAAIAFPIALAVLGGGVMLHDAQRAAPMTVLALAAVALGALIGFLFGIPRVNAADGAASRLRVNTNIEEISDWLTKILVGLSLANLGTLPQLFSRLAAYLSRNGFAIAASESMIASVCVFFLVDGFLFGYLATRLYLTGAFLAADPSEILKQVRPVLQSANLDASSEKPLSPAAKNAAQKMASLDPTTLQGADDLALWGRAQLGLGNVKKAAEAFAAAVTEAPERADLRIDHALALEQSGEARDKVLRELQNAYDRAGANPRARRRAVEGLMLNYLYVPNEFDRVIELGTRHLNAGGEASGKVYMYVAAAWGQKHQALPAEAKEERDNARSQALYAARQSLALDATLKNLFQRMLTGGKGDNDLVDFANDLEFQNLMKLY